TKPTSYWSRQVYLRPDYSSTWWPRRGRGRGTTDNRATARKCRSRGVHGRRSREQARVPNVLSRAASVTINRQWRALETRRERYVESVSDTDEAAVVVWPPN